jgi:hypothetical protein
MRVHSRGCAPVLPSVLSLSWLSPRPHPRMHRAYLLRVRTIVSGWWDWRLLFLLVARALLAW